MRALIILLCLNLKITAKEIPYIDLAKETDRQVIVDKEKGQYLGHPTTALLSDGKTVLCVYPKGHGKGPILYKRSNDAGKTWGKRLQTPTSWVSSKEVPTLFQVTDKEGNDRIIMFSGLYPIRMAYSNDEGKNWSELKSIGEFGGIVAMGTMISVKGKPGHYRALFHDDGRFISNKSNRETPVKFTLYSSLSVDGGMTWEKPETIYASTKIHLCEPGSIRSPDGKQIAVLLRENSRRENSYVIFSKNEGESWTEPRELPITLTGDRHTAKYLPDGRLFISFRCRTAIGSKLGVSKSPIPYEGDWAAWIGKYQNIVNGNPGQYVIRIADNKKGWDTTYPGVEILEDGTILTTTYGHWQEGEQPYIISVRLKANEIDQLAQKSPKLSIKSDTMHLE
ncbi:MAG: sialidase family protein [Verrucomicrobiales bacterium]|nr:exo-alpha-sialidase [Verrucomicrobiales bacterium]